MLRMVFDRLLLDPITSDKTPGGLYVPDNARQDLVRGRVVSRGPEVASAYEKSVVLYRRVHALSVNDEGKERHIIQEEAIVAVDENYVSPEDKANGPELSIA